MDIYYHLLLPVYPAMADAVKKESLIHTDKEMAFDTMGIGSGYGFRLNLGTFVLRYTRAQTVDGIGTDEFRSYWSLGADF